MWLVQGSSRLGYLSARSPTAMIRLLRSPASISLHATLRVNRVTAQNGSFYLTARQESRFGPAAGIPDAKAAAAQRDTCKAASAPSS